MSQDNNTSDQFEWGVYTNNLSISTHCHFLSIRVHMSRKSDEALDSFNSCCPSAYYKLVSASQAHLT
ncbi:hypothetical protein PILCRDRAFT_829089 [Piloderma croceum F 1598]|uniref:Uncharacterized protein n=1 Tax=Piloderma croceum (strain F 1598) TaxID=765440 RepID=A0A0C3B871_PILCF|nr:hypothetical protein PILCRDRAFT_829089 [Piloderma croceum F 1598]